MKTRPLVALALAATLVSGCAAIDDSAQGYTPAVVEHGMSVEEQREFRATQLVEMQAYSGEIVPGRDSAQEMPYKSETIEIYIEDLGQVEHTFWMEQHQGLVYSWEVLGETSNGGVFFDLHGHPGKENRDQFPERYFETYATGIQPSGHGIVDPGITGYHGWFFLNLEERPVVVRLTVSGFYDRHLEIYRSVAGELITAVDY